MLKQSSITYSMMYLFYLFITMMLYTAHGDESYDNRELDRTIRNNDAEYFKLEPLSINNIDAWTFFQQKNFAKTEVQAIYDWALESVLQAKPMSLMSVKDLNGFLDIFNRNCPAIRISQINNMKLQALAQADNQAETLKKLKSYRIRYSKERFSINDLFLNPEDFDDWQLSPATEMLILLPKGFCDSHTEYEYELLKEDLSSSESDLFSASSMYQNEALRFFLRNGENKRDRIRESGRYGKSSKLKI